MFPFPSKLKKLKESKNSEETQPLINRSLRNENKQRSSSIYNLRSRNVPRNSIINRTIQKPPIKPKPIALRYLGVNPTKKSYLADKSKLINTVNSTDININYMNCTKSDPHPMHNIFSGCYYNWKQNQTQQKANELKVSSISEKIVNNIIKEAVKSYNLDRIPEESDERDTSSESESESDTSSVNDLTLKEELEQHLVKVESSEISNEDSKIEETTDTDEKESNKETIDNKETDKDSKENDDDSKEIDDDSKEIDDDSKEIDEDSKEIDEDSKENDELENQEKTNEDVKTWWGWLWGY